MRVHIRAAGSALKWAARLLRIISVRLLPPRVAGNEPGCATATCTSSNRRSRWHRCSAAPTGRGLPGVFDIQAPRLSFCRRLKRGVHMKKRHYDTNMRIAGRVSLCRFCTGVIHTYGFSKSTPIVHIRSTSHSSPCLLMPLTGLAASCCRLPASAAVWGGFFESVLSSSLHGWPCVPFHAVYSRHASFRDVSTAEFWSSGSICIAAGLVNALP